MKLEFWHQLDTRILLLIKKLFLRKVQTRFVQSWSTATMGTCRRKSILLKRHKSLPKRMMYGRFFIRWCQGCKVSTKSRLFIEISSVRTCFSRKMAWSSLEILTYLKLPRLGSCRLRPVRHITLVQRSGKINHITTSQISGLSDASYTSLQLSILHSQPRI